VISSTPLDPTRSIYSKVVSYVDRKTCVAIKSESFQNGEQLRKLMTVEHPEQMLEDRGIYAPSEVLVKDLRDGTHTTVSAQDLEVDRVIDPRIFDEKRLGRHCN
jgi:hypothetical protein